MSPRKYRAVMRKAAIRKLEAHSWAIEGQPDAQMHDARDHYRKRANAKGHIALCCAESLECMRCGASGSVYSTPEGAQLASSSGLLEACKAGS